MSKSLTIFILFSLMALTSALSQSKNIVDFKDQKLQDVILEIEKNTNYSFNYRIDNLHKLSYTGPCDFENIQNSLDKILRHTSLQYEISNNQVLLIPAKIETWQICGTIKSELDHSSLAFANIYFDNYEKGAQADKYGSFKLNVQGYKNDQVSISYVGYETKSYIFQDFEHCIDFKLEVDRHYLEDEIVIKDYMMKGISEGAYTGAIHLDMPLVRKQAVGLENDILKTAQLISGISSIDDSASRINIRGSSFDHNLIGWENATLYDPGHFFGMISSINPYVVNKMDIYKTVFDPKYENRIGGVIDISLDSDIIKSTEFGIGTSLTEAHFQIKAPIIKDQMSIILSGRHSINKVINSPTIKSYSQKLFQVNRQEEDDDDESINDDYKEAEEDLNFYDINAKLIYKVSDLIQFSTSYFKSFNEYHYFSIFSNDKLEAEDDQRSNTSALNSTLDINWSELWRTKFYYSRSFYSNINKSLISQVADISASEIESQNSILDHQIGVLSEHNFNEHTRFDFGYIYEYKSVALSLQEQFQFQQGINDMNDEQGAFHNLVGSVHSNFKKWSLMTGLRATYYKEESNWFVSPRFQLQFRYSDDIKLKISGGKLYQFISQLTNFTDNHLNDFSNLWILSNPDVDTFLHSYKFSVGSSYRKNGWLLDSEFYAHFTKGLPNVSSSIGDFVEGVNPGESMSMGLDFMLHKSWGSYKFWTNYTLSTHEIVVPNITEEYFPSDINQTHQLSLVQQYSIGDLQFSLQYNYKSGLPFSEAEDDLEELDSDELLTNYFGLKFEEFNGERLPDYHRIDLGVQYNGYFFQNKIKYECGFNLVNLLNRKNILSRDFLVTDIQVDQQPDIIEVDKILLKRTPQLFVRFYW